MCISIKDKVTIRKKRMRFSAFFLFFSFFVVWFILLSTDTEYNMNQQIARGYITRNAIFFEMHDPTRVDAVAFSITSENIDLYSDSNGVIELDLSVGEAENRDYIFSNEVLSNGLTKVENIFNSLDGNYLVAIHDGELRGVLFRGDVTCPPVIEGRFFEEYECLSRDNLAVVGSDFLDDVYFKNNERFIQYNDKEYKVIGIVGIATSSTLDSMIFVNIGSLSPEKQLNKRYYIDGNNSMETIYSEMNENSLDLFGLELDRLDMPITLIDSASGGMYLKSYIKIIMVLFFIFLFFSTIIQNYKRQQLKIAIMSLVGVSFNKSFIIYGKHFLVSSLMGIICGFVVDVILIGYRIFALPFSFLWKYVILIFGAEILMFVGLIFVIAAGIKCINIGEVMKKA